MLSFQEQKYCGVALLALIIIAICIYQSKQMDRMAFTDVTTNDKSNIEGFSDEGLPAYNRIFQNGRVLDGIRSAQLIKYPDYASANTAFPVTAATLLEMQRGELGKINKGMQVEFIQALQDAEISGLKSRLEQVIEEGKKKGVLTTDGSKPGDVLKQGQPMRLRHLQSGAVFNTINRTTGPDAINKDFGIILDKDRGTCVKYISQTASQQEEGHTIEIVGCDYDPSLTSQRFRLKKIVSNDTFNRALHPDYIMYAIPEYNTLNAYPYYIVTPVDDPTGTMCLSIDDNGASIEPCVGKHSQRFSIA